MSSDSDAFGRTLIDFDPARPISSAASRANRHEAPLCAIRIVSSRCWVKPVGSGS